MAIGLDPGRRQAAGRVALVAAACFCTSVASGAAQQQPIDFVGGVASSQTSAEHSALGIARVEAATSRLTLTREWSVRGIGHAGWQPLFTMRDTTPVYREGLAVAGGFRIAHTAARIETAIVGRIGATRVGDDNNGDWAAFFEGGVDFRIAPLVDVYAGMRHDNRLPRTGALSSYRDPTGRMLLAVTVLPFRRGRFAAGVSLESENPVPGEGRLPSGVIVAALCRVGWRP